MTSRAPTGRRQIIYWQIPAFVRAASYGLPDFPGIEVLVQIVASVAPRLPAAEMNCDCILISCSSALTAAFLVPELPEFEFWLLESPLADCAAGVVEETVEPSA